MDDIVSVIVPVYNSVQYVDETINSIVNQSYHNLEIVLIDDGSADGSGKICDIWKFKDNRIKVIHTSNNGPSKARNIGIENSNGKYILPVDSDDLINPKYIEKAVNSMARNDDIGLAYCQAEFFGAETGRWDLPTFSIREMLITNCIFSTALFLKSDWAKVGGYSEEMKYGFEDYDFWLSLISIGIKVYQIPEILFYYRKHSGSRTELFKADSVHEQETRLIKYYRHKNLYLQYYRIVDIEKRVVLYGGGYAGKSYIKFLMSINHNNVICCADESFRKLNSEGFPIEVIGPCELHHNGCDAIVITINNLDTVKKIKDKLSCEFDVPIYWYFNDSEVLT